MTASNKPTGEGGPVAESWVSVLKQIYHKSNALDNPDTIVVLHWETTEGPRQTGIYEPEAMLLIPYFMPEPHLIFEASLEEWERARDRPERLRREEGLQPLQQPYRRKRGRR